MQTQTNEKSAKLFSGITGELKKVTWPTRKQAAYLTTVVFVISLIVGAYVGIIDLLMAKVLAVITSIR